MKKTAVLLVLAVFLGNSLLVSAEPANAPKKKSKGLFGYNLQDDINRKSKKEQAQTPAPQKKESTPKQQNNVAPKEQELQFYGDDTEAEWLNSDLIFYPDASLDSAIIKYQEGNYSGCLQELLSLVQVDTSNSVLYYYLAMAYTQIGNKEQAVKAYEQVIKLNADEILTKNSIKGRDCLVGGPACLANDATANENKDPLEEFINSPYGNGFSKELNEQFRQKELDKIQDTINKKDVLEQKDIERIQKFDLKSEKKNDIVTNEDIISAIEILKKAGITVSLNANPQLNNEYAQLSMLLGNNNSNNNSMMNMLPYMFGSEQKLDPQLIQSVMMNSMLTDFTFTEKDKKY